MNLSFTKNLIKRHYAAQCLPSYRRGQFAYKQDWDLRTKDELAESKAPESASFPVISLKIWVLRLVARF
jgi:hypothetical protein